MGVGPGWLTADASGQGPVEAGYGYPWHCPGSWKRQRVLRADAEARPGWEVIIQQEGSKRSGAEGGNVGDLGSGGLRGNSLGVAMGAGG